MSTPNTPGAPAAPPSCYWHPGRATYVSCTRCGRPICPDCMRNAAVGQHCVECVNEGAKSVRRVQSTTGGRPIVTYVLIAANVVMFILQKTSGEVFRQFVLQADVIAYYDQYYRLVTSGFLHGGITHILFNMVALYFTGPALERLLGPARFIGLYGLSLLGGSVLVYLLTPVDQPTLGASGAIFGLFGAAFVLARKLDLDVRGIVGLIVVNLVITFIAPGISWQGHVGGLLTGVLVAWVYAYAPQAKRTLVEAGCSVALLLVFSALIWWRSSAILSAVGVA
ncbi:MAG: rhomboid family intramembrane serine protease [Mycobacterium sp.]